MKKIIILILVLIVIAAAYFLLTTKKEEPVEEPVGDLEVPVTEPVQPPKLPLYLGAEFITQIVEEAGDLSYYAVAGSPLKVADFYAATFPDFTAEEDPVVGYHFYNDKALALAEELQHRSKFMDWKKANKGLVLVIDVLTYDPENEYCQDLEEYKEELEGKTIILIAHL